jgi:hypothetical protein
MIKCIICLDMLQSELYNLCCLCDNFIVCNSCYNNNVLHEMKHCPHCRTKLTKQFNYSYNTFKIICIYYKFTIIHILFNIIYSNIFLYYYFPYDHKIYPYFPSTITQLLLINNLCNFIVIPSLYLSFKHYFKMSVMYAFINIIYPIIFYTTPKNTHIQLYYIYYVIYFYILTLLKFIAFNSYYLLVSFNISVNHLINTNLLHHLAIYNIVPNFIHNTRV